METASGWTSIAACEEEASETSNQDCRCDYDCGCGCDCDHGLSVALETGYGSTSDLLSSASLCAGGQRTWNVNGMNMKNMRSATKRFPSRRSLPSPAGLLA